MRLPIRHLLIACLASLATMTAIAAPALGSSGSKAVADCNANGRLTHTYTIPQLENALATLPPYVREYTPCYDVIQRALLVLEGKKVSGSGAADGSSGGSALPTAVIVVIVVLLVAAATLGAVAVRRRRHQE